MYIREIMILYICALVHFTGIECALVVTPKNEAVVSGESVTLHCASDVSKGNIVWSTTAFGSYQKDQIYNNYTLASTVSLYISVSDREDGNCSLTIKASLTAAKRYICTEADSGLEASAELIVLIRGLQCNSTIGSVRVSCSTVSAGFWVPVVKCYQWKPGDGRAGLAGNQAVTIYSNMVTRTWNYVSKNEWFHIFCEAGFSESERPKESTATNIPKNFGETLGKTRKKTQYQVSKSTELGVETLINTLAKTLVYFPLISTNLNIYSG